MELDFPLRQQQMDRLRFLAQHLQQSLQPSSKVVFNARVLKKLLKWNLEQDINYGTVVSSGIFLMSVPVVMRIRILLFT
jgi:hypothetical protein